MKIACVQLNSGSDIAANIAKVETLVAEAADEGAELIALPENAFLMDVPTASHPRHAQDEHVAVQASAALAKKHRCWLLAGSIAVATNDKSKNVNRSLLFNPEGQVAASYDKIHLFDVDIGDGQTYRESEKMLPGCKAVLFDAPWGKTGVTVCYDLRFPQLFRFLAKAGAGIITVPSAFTRVTGEAHWHVLLRARAIENGCFIVAPAQCGTHPGGRKTFGHSLIVDPWGKILAEGSGEKEGVIFADIDLGQVAKVRKSLPSLTHDREFTF
jgi:deaminated glutathione amidase